MKHPGIGPLTLLLALALGCSVPERPTVVLLTDFGTRDGAVASMKGIVASVDGRIPVEDLTHEIPPFDVWEAAYRLSEAAPYWPDGTLFVCVVDPGVGTERRPIVLKTESGHLFVGPDNGLFTIVAASLGVDEVRRIDETENRRPGSERSHTFHGRDLFAHAAARLAGGVIPFRDVGPEIETAMITIPYRRPELAGGALKGVIPVLDTNFGNVWTNIGEGLLAGLGARWNDTLDVVILHAGEAAARLALPYVPSFGAVGQGEDLLYINSQGNISFASNLDSFAAKHGIGSGPDWEVEIRGADDNGHTAP